MGDLKNKRIIQTRNWLDPNQAPIPTLDYDYVFPITVYEAVKRDMDDNSPNLSDELNSIYRLIADKQDIIQGGTPGQLMIWSGIQGQIGSLDVTKVITTDPAARSHQKIPTERAVGDALDTKASHSALTAHTNDHSIHLTDIERSRWNAMAPLSSLQSHVSNAVMHITNDERARWNSKAEAKDLETHIYNTTNPHNVTAHQVGTYTRKEVDDMFATLRESFFNYLNISWDDRSNKAELVNYHPSNWNPNYVLAFKDALPDIKDPTQTYFALKPATDYSVNETNDCLIFIKRPGLAWQEVGSTAMRAGDMIIKYPDTSMYVWVQGRFIRLFSESSSDPGDGLNGNVWKPTVDEKGLLTWLLSKETTAPTPITIKGKDGYSPIKGIDYDDGKNGEGVPVGGNQGDLLIKLSGENFDTTWKSLIDIFKDLALSGTYLPADIVLWDNIKGRPVKYNELGPNEDGYITQKAATRQFEIVNNQITEILSKVDGPAGLEGIKNDLYEHINDYNNPHRVTPAQIGAVSISTHSDHIQNYNNPHNVTKAQVGLSDVDNTSDVNKPISNATQIALDLIKTKLDTINDNIAASKYIVNVTWDNPTNTLVFEFKDHTTLSVTIPITDLFNKIHFDDKTKELVIELPDGTQNRINISALIQTYYGSIGANIQVVVENDRIIKASIIPGTVGEYEIIPSVHLRSSPTTTTQPVSDRSDRIATTQFVSGQVINNLISYETDRPLSANMGRMLNQRKADIEDVIKIINDLEGISVIDTLDSTSPLAALSANMGRYLDLVKAPRVHTSPSGSTFGRATISLFGHTRAAETDPLMDGTVFRGTDDGRYARGDHRHPTDITRAPLHSPEFTGEPKTPTPPDDSNDERIPNTEWVRRNAVGVAKGFCDTVGDTATKIVTLKSDFMTNPVFLRQTGSTITVTFDYTDTSTDPTKLDVHGSGPAPVLYGGLPITANMISAKYSHIFTFDGTNWRLLNPAGIHTLDDADNSNRFVSSEWVRRNIPGTLWGFSNTPEDTTIKVATLKSSYMANPVFIRQIGSTVVIKFTNADDSPGVTQLDVHGTGAAPIHFESRPIKASMIGKGLDHIFTFDGSNWQLLNPSLMGTEEYGGLDSGGINQMSEFLGFTIEGHGGSTNPDGEVDRVLITIPFKNFKPENSKVTISDDPADWGIRMGDNRLINLIDPIVLFATRGHAVIQFTMTTPYPSNSPCALVARRPQAYLKVESNSAPIPFVAVTSIDYVPTSINVGSTINLGLLQVTPVNATNQIINWTVLNANGTGAAIANGNLKTTASGLFTIRATVINGATETSDFVKDFTVTSVAASITINSQPIQLTEVSAGSITETLSVNASIVSGTLSYQWYSNTTNSNVGGTPVTGATNATFDIPTNIGQGDYYYFCEVGASGGASPIRSNVATVKVSVKVTGVTISPKPASVMMFESVQLTANIIPANATNKTVTWSTSDSTIATVNNTGLVSAIKNGSVTITATTVDGKYKDTCTINVTEFISINTITNVPTQIVANTSLTLTSTINPANATNKTIEWSIIDDKAVGATLTSGNVLRIPDIANAIQILIRATIKDGIHPGVPYTQDFIINGKPDFIPAQSIIGILPESRVNVALPLTNTVLPVEATNKDVVWTIVDDGGTTSSITNNELTATKSGTVKIKGTIVNGLTKTTDYTQEFDIIIMAEFIAVTDISNLPSVAFKDIELKVSEIVIPTNATNKDVEYKVITDGGTNILITKDGFLASSLGTATIEASIKNGITDGTISNGTATGTPYVKTFTIEVKDFIPTTDITDLPTSMRLDTTLELSGKTIPANASHQNIAWSIIGGGGTGATITEGNKLKATSVGTVKVRAKIVNGIEPTGSSGDYIEDFDIIILPPFIPINNITGLAAEIEIPNTLDLTNRGSIVPSDATNQSPKNFSIVDNGGTRAVINNNILTATSPGTVKVRITIPKGSSDTTDYVREFDVVVTAPPIIPVTGITGIVTSGRSASTITLTPVIAPADATNKNIIWSILDDGNTNSIINGDKLTITNQGSGMMKITATIVNGISYSSNYTKNFTIITLPPFVQVTDFTSTIPTSMMVGDTITLSGTVVPANASNKNVAWSVVSGPGTIASGKLTATGEGAIKVRATIARGTTDTSDYTKDFDINVAPVS